MPTYTYTTTDQGITDKPCILYSVIVHNDGANEGVVDIYDGTSAEAGYKVARLMCGVKSCQQYRWTGLKLTRGLYVDIVERAESAVVEWEPVGYSEKGREWVKALRESVS